MQEKYFADSTEQIVAPFIVTFVVYFIVLTLLSYCLTALFPYLTQKYILCACAAAARFSFANIYSKRETIESFCQPFEVIYVQSCKGAMITYLMLHLLPVLIICSAVWFI